MSEEKWVMPAWMEAMTEALNGNREDVEGAMNLPWGARTAYQDDIFTKVRTIEELYAQGFIPIKQPQPQEETWMDAVLNTAQQNVTGTLRETGLLRNVKWFQKYMDMLDGVDETTPEDHHTFSTLGRSFTVTRGHLDDGVPKHTTHDYCASEVIMHFPFLSELVWMNVTHPEGNFSAEWGSLDSFTRVELKPL